MTGLAGTMRSWPVVVTDDVTLDGAGAGTVLLGPVPPQRCWSPGVVSATNPGTGKVQAYIGPAEGSPVAASSTDPAVVQMADAGLDLYAGQYVTVTWTGGTPGALVSATMRARGAPT